MNEDVKEAPVSFREDSHPWLARQTADEDDDSLDEVIRYTLDEIRFA